MPTRKKGAAEALRRLGDLLARRRILRSQTQEEISDAAGVSVQFVRKVERGKGNPSYLTLQAIAEALELDVEIVVRKA